MEKTEDIIAQINVKEKQAKKRAILFTFIPVFIGLFLIFYTSRKVTQAQSELALISKEADSLKILRDNFRLEYLKAKGYDFSTKKTLLSESIKADSLLAHLQVSDSVSSKVAIEYYRKSLDQEKVWISLKELGYGNISEKTTTNKVLGKEETNTIALGKNVPLFDIKIIALTLIRAGFKIQHVYFIQRNDNKNLIQIIRTAPADGSPDKSHALSVEQIEKAESIDVLMKPTR